MNEPQLHPEHPYTWMLGHYVPRIVIRSGQVARIRVRLGEWGSPPRIDRQHTATGDGLVQGVCLRTAPLHSPAPGVPGKGIPHDPYFFGFGKREILTRDSVVRVELWIGERRVLAEQIVEVECLCDGCGIQVAPLDAERRRRVAEVEKGASLDDAPSETMG